MNSSQLERARQLLCSLQNSIRDALIEARRRDSMKFADVDTIHGVDNISGEAIFAWFETHWPATWPVEVVMEGLKDGVPHTFPRGTPIARTHLKCILDPIDGTRGFMYEKRPAWSLAALAPQRGSQTDLADIVVAAMTELPTSKQWRADQFSVVRGGKAGVVATSCDVRSGDCVRLRFRPSQAEDFRHGFASLARCYPDGKAFIAQLEEKLWRTLHGSSGVAPLIFADQYMCTGGQLAEVLSGHDRLVGDIRPMVYAKLRLDSALSCHPYDICTALIAREAGVIVEAPDGSELCAPLDTITPVSWIAYANPTLARLARPVIRQLIYDHL